MTRSPRDRSPPDSDEDEHGTFSDASPSASARARAHAHVKTKDEVLEDIINEVIDMAVDNGMTRDDAYAVLYRMVDKLADTYRSGLKVHPKET